MSADVMLLNGRINLCVRANSAELTIYSLCDEPYPEEDCTFESVMLDNRNDVEELVHHLQHLLDTITFSDDESKEEEL